MRPPLATSLTLSRRDDIGLSALLMKPRAAQACFVFAHGAGAGMNHPFMDQIAKELYSRKIATLRFQFPFMQKGSKRPDVPAVAHAAIRLAVAEARRRCRSIPIIAGGKSFGGRMTSQTQAEAPIEGVRGLAFIGFPLHPSGTPSIVRADHLPDVRVPMLFVQGTRDKLAELTLLRPALQELGRRATLYQVEDADHAFHVPARSGRTDRDIIAGIALAISQWIGRFEA